MTATARDTRTVVADTRADAIDVARRRWQLEGLRLVEVVDVRIVPGAWRVEAIVEVRRS